MTKEYSFVRWSSNDATCGVIWSDITFKICCIVKFWKIALKYFFSLISLFDSENKFYGGNTYNTISEIVSKIKNRSYKKTNFEVIMKLFALKSSPGQ